MILHTKIYLVDENGMYVEDMHVVLGDINVQAGGKYDFTDEDDCTQIFDVVVKAVKTRSIGDGYVVEHYMLGVRPQ